MIKCFNQLSEGCVAVSKSRHRHQIPKKDSLEFWKFLQKSKDESTVITHFNDHFPDSGEGLRKELPLLIKDLQIKEYSNYLLQDT